MTLIQMEEKKQLCLLKIRTWQPSRGKDYSNSKCMTRCQTTMNQAMKTPLSNNCWMLQISIDLHSSNNNNKLNLKYHSMSEAEAEIKII